MSGKGPTPTGNASRRNKQPKGITIKSDDEVRGFELPKGYLGKEKYINRNGVEAERDVPWHPATVDWWDEWRRSPQAVQMMTGPDWSYLLDTALMHHAMWISKRFDVASEVRQRASKFGATPEDRLRLRLTIEVPETAPVGNAVDGPKTDELEIRRQRMIAQEAERRKQG